MSFKDEVFVEKLRKLRETQESIQTLSKWVMFHKRHHEKIVTLWKDFVIKANPQERVNLLYLCSDIMHESRRKGMDFLKDFYMCLPQLVQEISCPHNDRVYQAATKLFNVWKERQLFRVAFLNGLQSVLDEGKKNSNASENKISESRDTGSTTTDDRTGKHQLWSHLAAYETHIASAEKVSSEVETMRKDIFTENFLEKNGGLEEIVSEGPKEVARLRDAVVSLAQLVAKHKQTLEGTLEGNQALLLALEEAIDTEKARRTHTEQQIEQCKSRALRLMEIIAKLEEDTVSKVNTSSEQQSNVVDDGPPPLKVQKI